MLIRCFINSRRHGHLAVVLVDHPVRVGLTLVMVMMGSIFWGVDKLVLEGGWVGLIYIIKAY